MKRCLNISIKELFDRCIYFSIGHAVYTCYNPMFSYEQSWDGLNYSFQNGYSRGTISFDMSQNIVVGAARNDLCNRMKLYPRMDAIDLFETDLIEVKKLASREALEYLYETIDDCTKPMATVAMWSEKGSIILSDEDKVFNENGGEFISVLLGTRENMMNYLVSAYEFVDRDISVIDYIFDKYKNEEKKIRLPLSMHYLKKTAGYKEGIESLKEMGIEVP